MRVRAKSSTWAVAAISLAACWSTTNTSGLFVTDVVVREGGLDVQRCELVEYERHDLIRLDDRPAEEHRSWVDRCQWEAVELPVGISPPYQPPSVAPVDPDAPEVLP